MRAGEIDRLAEEADAGEVHAVEIGASQSRTVRGRRDHLAGRMSTSTWALRREQLLERRQRDLCRHVVERARCGLDLPGDLDDHVDDSGALRAMAGALRRARQCTPPSVRTGEVRR